MSKLSTAQIASIVEASKGKFFFTVKLICDGAQVSIQKEFSEKTGSYFMVYVNGVVLGKDCGVEKTEVNQKYYLRRTKRIHGDAFLKKCAKLYTKAELAKMRADVIEYYTPNGRNLKSLLVNINNNAASVELVDSF